MSFATKKLDSILNLRCTVGKDEYMERDEDGRKPRAEDTQQGPNLPHNEARLSSLHSKQPLFARISCALQLCNLVWVLRRLSDGKQTRNPASGSWTHDIAGAAVATNPSTTPTPEIVTLETRRVNGQNSEEQELPVASSHTATSCELTSSYPDSASSVSGIPEFSSTASECQILSGRHSVRALVDRIEMIEACCREEAGPRHIPIIKKANAFQSPVSFQVRLGTALRKETLKRDSALSEPPAATERPEGWSAADSVDESQLYESGTEFYTAKSTWSIDTGSLNNFERADSRNHESFESDTSASTLAIRDTRFARFKRRSQSVLQVFRRNHRG